MFRGAHHSYWGANEQSRTALKMAALKIVGAMRRIAPGPRRRLGPTIVTAAIFMSGKFCTAPEAVFLTA
jgi:hypothetical protein